jgi:hypothetical protein
MCAKTQYNPKEVVKVNKLKLCSCWCKLYFPQAKYRDRMPSYIKCFQVNVNMNFLYDAIKAKLRKAIKIG